MPTNKGAFKIFTLAGISVYVHWSWFLVAIYSVQFRTHEYSSIIWNVLEYLSLFAIVLTHEFGHQLSCRSVGGKTHDIVLWPLGGVAYVSPPQRPGAQLWSIAAGPLVNVVLVPVFAALWSISWHLGWNETHHDAYELFHNIWVINLVLLIFNMMPIYPLDGGQILRSLLWFVFGRANSLLAASIIGFIGVAALIGLAIWAQSIWLGIMAVFILMNCWNGFNQSRELYRRAKAPRHNGYICPTCKTAPPQGEFWRCVKCRQRFDAIATQLVCPHCGIRYSVMTCLECGGSRPIEEWNTAQN
jgi:Zn-dependent protease